MADGGPPGLKHLSHPHYTASRTLCPTCKLPPPPVQPIAPPTQAIQLPMPQLNWSHFKPEFADKTKMWKHIILGPMT